MAASGLSDKHWQEGYDAAYAGRDRCPYNGNTDAYFSWISGWNQAKLEIRNNSVDE